MFLAASINIYRLSRMLVAIAVLLIFVASQLFWIFRVRDLMRRFIKAKRLRRYLGVAGIAVLVFLLAYNIQAEREPTSTQLTLQAALLVAPFRWWVLGSAGGLAIIVVLSVLDRAVRGLLRVVEAFRQNVSRLRSEHWIDTRGRALRRGDAAPPSDLAPRDVPAECLHDRRRFLEQTAVAIGALPFVAGAYGLFYGRLDLETTHRRLRLERCPKAFQGFRIAQLSDFHIGPFMTENEIRKIVAVANRLKPDLIVLTGDYVTWDPGTQGAVVSALGGLKAPLGVFGCLGNHELWTETQDSITRLFATEGIRILRHERAPILVQGETINLIGVDFQTRPVMGGRGRGVVRSYLEGVDRLVQPDTVNILLSHNPNTFDRAAELGIDLSLAGHTHGGQVTLEFVSRNVSPSRLITPYVEGWYAKPGGQIYVNRGIGTIGVPIRINCPPEVTVFEFVRDQAAA